MATQPPAGDGKPRKDPDRPTPAFTETDGAAASGKRRPADTLPERGDTTPAAPAPHPPESDVNPETPASINSP